MSRYTTRHEHLGPWPVVALVDTETGASVRLAQHGATLLEYLVPFGDTLRDVADGFTTADALEAAPGAHFAIMCPFANRVADARYRFGGVAHDLMPGVVGDARRILHGFVRHADFALVAVDADDTGASARLRNTDLRVDAWPGYPFAVDLDVTFTLHGAGLDLTAEMRNVGDTPAPCFFGWHPYLRLRDDGIDALELTVPARTAIVLDDHLIPLSGAGAFRPVETLPDADFRHAKAIGTTVLDNGYTELAADADGRIRTCLRDPDSGLAISMWQESGVLQIYTGDTLQGPARRRAVAMEPMQAMANTFNRPDCLDAITLAPGATRQFRCGLEVHLR